MSQTITAAAMLTQTNHLQVPFSQLNGQVPIGDDGDRIAVQVTKNVCTEAYIMIGLRLGPGITWWKGIQLDEIVVVQCQDSQNFSVSQVGYEDFKKRHLNFWKAKFFGVHTPMYTVADALGAMEPGNQYIFEWLKD